MPEIITADAYRKILLADTPLIDVRAPVEFARGSFPAAVNLPLLNDVERQQVGIRFKEAGQDAAIKLGEQLISGNIKQERLAQWCQFIEQHPDSLVFCYRGGLRSRTTQEWLHQAGFDIPRIAGGYKAMRRFLLETISSASLHCTPLLVAGKTGCAKTRLVNRLQPSIDLEGLANHRGSAFGPRVEPQPAQIDFENRLAIALLRLPFEDFQRVVLEDESRAIGSLSLPVELHATMIRAPVALIEEPLAYRINTVLQEYIQVNFEDYLRADPEIAEQRFSDYLLSSLQKIRRRLGSDLFEDIHAELTGALLQQFQEQTMEPHRRWIEKLLRGYYDPMYEYQLGKKAHRIVFRGDSEEFLRWASHIQYRSNPSSQ